MDSFHPLGVAFKNRSKVKKNLPESIKSDTKAGKTRVSNELQPKLIHNTQSLIRTFSKRSAKLSCDLSISGTGSK